MSTAMIAAEETYTPVSSALKNLAKVHGLPPFERLYTSGRKTVIAIDDLVSEDWRAALALPPFDADGTTVGFWFGDQIRLVRVVS